MHTHLKPKSVTRDNKGYDLMITWPIINENILTWKSEAENQEFEARLRS